MLYKAFKGIENAWKRGQKVNVELDESGNLIVNAGDKDESEAEIIIAKSLCEPTKMLYVGTNACISCMVQNGSSVLFENQNRQSKYAQ